MIEEVDYDNTGEIEFEEFLTIIKNASNGSSSGNAKGVGKFFKDMANGKVG